MSIRDLIREALHSLESNKGRSLLTILGIVIGIASVIAMTSLIGGIRPYQQSGPQCGAHDPNLFIRKPHRFGYRETA